MTKGDSEPKDLIKPNKTYFLEKYFGYEDHIMQKNKLDLIRRIEDRIAQRRGDRAV